jgi:flagellar hook-associated protein 3 FlgL
MRIGNFYANQVTTDAILRNQVNLYATQSQLSSGRKVVNPSDDPNAMSQITNARAVMAAETSYQKNQVFLEAELRGVESTLGNIGNSLSSARETLIQAGNPTLSSSDRLSLAAALRERRAEVLQLANTRGADGQYIFSGFQSGSAPFADTGAGVVFSGDNGVRGILVGPSRTITSNADGAGLFMNVPRGNGVFATDALPTNSGTGRIDTGGVLSPSALTGQNYEIRFTSASTYVVVNSSLGSTVQSGSYTAGATITFDGMQVVLNGQPAAGDGFNIVSNATSDIFSVFDRAIAAMSAPVLSDGQRSQLADATRAALADIDQMMSRSLEMRGDAGAKLNALDLQRQVSENTTLDAGLQLSGLEDVDYAEASTRFAQQKAALDAALAAYAQTSRSSLFDYLR